MITKIIHYCWFGNGTKNRKINRCMDTWKKYCPDYQIIEWNELNSDFLANPFVRSAYESKKYAFVSDYIRLQVVYQYGGIYLDTDVELIKNLDSLLDNKALIGFENEAYVNSGQILAAESGNGLLLKMIHRYEKEPFQKPDGSIRYLSCPTVNTEVLVDHGLQRNGREQIVDGMHIYPSEYFNPLDSATHRLSITENTYSIHWYAMSWVPRHKRWRSHFTSVFHRWFGTDCFSWIKRNHHGS